MDSKRKTNQKSLLLHRITDLFLFNGVVEILSPLINVSFKQLALASNSKNLFKPKIILSDSNYMCTVVNVVQKNFSRKKELTLTKFIVILWYRIACLIQDNGSISAEMSDMLDNLKEKYVMESPKNYKLE